MPRASCFCTSHRCSITWRPFRQRPPHRDHVSFAVQRGCSDVAAPHLTAQPNTAPRQTPHLHVLSLPRRLRRYIHSLAEAAPQPPLRSAASNMLRTGPPETARHCTPTMGRPRTPHRFNERHAALSARRVGLVVSQTPFRYKDRAHQGELTQTFSSAKFPVVSV